ncbi:MAG: hypothetical protein NTV54_14095 [Ignavibacteriales bacterium]|nr:hypothetical protein [Ignavibacteriales bacterium]
MLQQTQVARVTLYYRDWLRLFPSFRALAAASKRDVLQAWSGLGYNSRALRLQSLARIVADQQRGRLPADTILLQQLPGIGKYTAHALGCFAFGLSLPVVDVNARRILTRLFSKVTAADEMLDEKCAWEIAASILPRDAAYDWNQALMDLGAGTCTAVNPVCDACPFTDRCSSSHLPVLRLRSVRTPRKEPSFHGVPRRIVRGNILKILHAQSREVAELRSSLSVRLRRHELLAVLSAMQRDGLIEVRKLRGRILVSIASS